MVMMMMTVMMKAHEMRQAHLQPSNVGLSHYMHFSVSVLAPSKMVCENFATFWLRYSSITHPLLCY